jgi:hypothetical protein
MGVRVYLLDRRPTTLPIGGTVQTIGTLRQFCKLTEMDIARSVEETTAAQIIPSPTAAMIIDVTESPLVDDPDNHVVGRLRTAKYLSDKATNTVDGRHGVYTSKSLVRRAETPCMRTHYWQQRSFVRIKAISHL